MSSRLSALRLFCRIQLRRSGVDRAAIRQAMRDDDVLQVVLAEIHSTHVSTAALDGMTFLDWLLEHADEIIALIMKIIAMFPASMEAFDGMLAGPEEAVNMASVEAIEVPEPRANIVWSHLLEWRDEVTAKLEQIDAAISIVKQLA